MCMRGGQRALQTLIAVGMKELPKHSDLQYSERSHLLLLCPPRRVYFSPSPPSATVLSESSLLLSTRLALGCLWSFVSCISL